MKFNDKQFSQFNGRKISLEVFGASHAKEIGVIAKGFKGERFDKDKLQKFMDRRKPKSTAYSTKRKEGDQPIFTCGEKNGLLKNKFKAVILNSDQRSVDYKNTVKTPRPSHADFVAWTKYGDGFDYRGGGKFSGRLTAPICIAGGIAKQILENKGIKIDAYILSIGKASGKGVNQVENLDESLNNLSCDFPVLDKESEKPMMEEVESARLDGDSVGGVIECVIRGVPVGVGEYMFDSLESVISELAFAVPAVKGIEFGSGFELAKMRGSQANDSFYYDENSIVKTKTNHNGGINGGMANGMPITFRVVVKPTPSIAKEQDTIDLKEKTNVKLKIAGRHDACIVPRAVPVIEAISALAIYDSL